MESSANREKTGRFVPGQSGNPNGRPKKPEWFNDRFSMLSEKAVQRLVEIIEDECANRKDVLKACEIALNYGLGKPVQRNEIAGPDGNSLKIELAETLKKWAQ